MIHKAAHGWGDGITFCALPMDWDDTTVGRRDTVDCPVCIWKLDHRWFLGGTGWPEPTAEDFRREFPFVCIPEA